MSGDFLLVVTCIKDSDFYRQILKITSTIWLDKTTTKNEQQQPPQQQ